MGMAEVLMALLNLIHAVAGIFVFVLFLSSEYSKT
jgi:hypothetical protein